MPLKPASKPFTLRLTHEERARLEVEAGAMPLGAYMRSRLLGDEPAHRQVRAKATIKDREALGRALGLLGRSDLSKSLKTLAREAETGSLPVTPETEEALQKACKAVDAMAAAIMKALGFHGGPE